MLQRIYGTSLEVPGMDTKSIFGYKDEMKTRHHLVFLMLHGDCRAEKWMCKLIYNLLSHLEGILCPVCPSAHVASILQYEKTIGYSEKCGSKTKIFFGLSACQLQAVEQVFLQCKLFFSFVLITKLLFYLRPDRENLKNKTQENQKKIVKKKKSFWRFILILHMKSQKFLLLTFSLTCWKRKLSLIAEEQLENTGISQTDQFTIILGTPLVALYLVILKLNLLLKMNPFFSYSILISLLFHQILKGRNYFLPPSILWDTLTTGNEGNVNMLPLFLYKFFEYMAGDGKTLSICILLEEAIPEKGYYWDLKYGRDEDVKHGAENYSSNVQWERVVWRKLIWLVGGDCLKELLEGSMSWCAIMVPFWTIMIPSCFNTSQHLSFKFWLNFLTDALKGKRRRRWDGSDFKHWIGSTLGLNRLNKRCSICGQEKINKGNNYMQVITTMLIGNSNFTILKSSCFLGFQKNDNMKGDNSMGCFCIENNIRSSIYVYGPAHLVCANFLHLHFSFSNIDEVRELIIGCNDYSTVYVIQKKDYLMNTSQFNSRRLKKRKKRGIYLRRDELKFQIAFILCLIHSLLLYISLASFAIVTCSFAFSFFHCKKKTCSNSCMIQPSFEAQSLCILHSDCSKKYTHANRQLSKFFWECLLSVSLVDEMQILRGLHVLLPVSFGFGDHSVVFWWCGLMLVLVKVLSTNYLIFFISTMLLCVFEIYQNSRRRYLGVGQDLSTIKNMLALSLIRRKLQKIQNHSHLIGYHHLISLFSKKRRSDWEEEEKNMNQIKINSQQIVIFGQDTSEEFLWGKFYLRHVSAQNDVIPNRMISYSAQDDPDTAHYMQSWNLFQARESLPLCLSSHFSLSSLFPNIIFLLPQHFPIINSHSFQAIIPHLQLVLNLMTFPSLFSIPG
ncbi:hypothetical protein VP01_646g1 [Puccinia sorghi]|uniref:Uncharacterized protein n=1 Tax=Puccinia sorghi TaxID=27349 RepID=A0A0L6UFR2_9BASI|nr:hypothetical protein VP01_646g1 [Puccinia sorghi]